jgi:hypothetical protein
MVANASPSGRQDSQGASSETGLIFGDRFLFYLCIFPGLSRLGWRNQLGSLIHPEVHSLGWIFFGEEGRKEISEQRVVGRRAVNR